MSRQLATADLETDPFQYDTVVQPFLFGFYDGKNVTTIWDESPEMLIKRSVAFLDSIQQPLIIYFHNGGRFDIFYYLEHLGAQLRIVNSRIIQCTIGKHEIRDSFAIMPFPLAAYKKDDIDYRKLDKKVRAQHREEILTYLHGDVKYLHELVTRFHQEFGDSLTIGSTSMKQLRTISKFDVGGEAFDERFRKPFYHGGRCQTFEAGVLKGEWKIVDVNSMYPYAMKAFLHPVGTAATVSRDIEDDTCFVVAEGWNYGAFPTRTKTGGLDFSLKYGTFSVTIHEWLAARDTRTFKVKKIHKCYGFQKRESFAPFVDHFYESRNIARAAGDDILVLFYKFVLNSAYGKFAQNPSNYFEWQICPIGTRPEPWYQCSELCRERNPGHDIYDDGKLKLIYCPYEWEVSARFQGVYWLWKKHLDIRRYFNVCTGASITGAARALLLRGLVAVDRPIYCDTDSIICRDTGSLSLSDSELGAWKVEGVGSLACIAGKKQYAIFDGPVCKCKDGTACGHSKKKPADCTCIKKANKGSRLTGRDIESLCNGEEIVYKNPVPSYNMSGKPTFIKRRIRRTAI